MDEKMTRDILVGPPPPVPFGDTVANPAPPIFPGTAIVDFFQQFVSIFFDYDNKYVHFCLKIVLKALVTRYFERR